MSIEPYNAISALLITTGIVLLQPNRQKNVTRVIFLLLCLTLWIVLWVLALEYIVAKPGMLRWLFDRSVFSYSTTLLGISVVLELSCWLLAMSITAILLHLAGSQKNYRVSTSIMSICLIITLVFPQLQFVESYLSIFNINEQIISGFQWRASLPAIIQTMILILAGLLGWLSPVILRI